MSMRLAQRAPMSTVPGTRKCRAAHCAITARRQSATVRRSAVAEVAQTVQSAHEAPAGEGVGFYRGDDDHLYCDNLKVEECRQAHLGHLTSFQARQQPCYLYSKAKMTGNFQAYRDAMADLPHIIGYAVKANNNIWIMRHLCAMGSGAVLVSGNELLLAKKAGFDTTKTVLNGNGKLPWELELGVREGVLINIDSEFDFENIVAAAKAVAKPVKVLLRINPDVDPQVHPYISTGMASSKFGIQNTHLDWFLDRIKAEEMVDLVGVHCHLGSTIKEVSVFRDAAKIMCDFIRKINTEGFKLQYLNFGGGLGIDYTHTGESYPSPRDLIDTVRDDISDLGLTMIIEPGRSMVGNTAALVCTVTGVKANGDKRFIVVDGSMSNLIRPSLYDAYQHIELTAPCKGKESVFDIVGPVCESADFLGKDRQLPKPDAGAGIVVHDAGAYGMVMASAYNLQMPPAEYWIENGGLVQIKAPTELHDWLAAYSALSISQFNEGEQPLESASEDEE